MRRIRIIRYRFARLFRRGLRSKCWPLFIGDAEGLAACAMRLKLHRIRSAKFQQLQTCVVTILRCAQDIEGAEIEVIGVRVFIDDQADRSFWRKVKEKVPRLDVLIDDGDTQHVLLQQGDVRGKAAAILDLQTGAQLPKLLDVRSWAASCWHRRLALGSTRRSASCRL